MNKTVTMLLSLAVGLAAGVPLGGRLMSPRAEAESPATTTSAAAVPDAIGAQDISGPYEVQKGGRRISRRCRATRSGPMAARAASSPRARIACSCSAAASCRTSRVRRRSVTRTSDRTCSSRSAVCRGAMPTRRRLRAAADRARIRRRAWTSGEATRRRIASSAWTPAGSTRVIVVNAQGKIIEEWTQWDKMFKRPHAVYVSPYDRGEARLDRGRSHACDLQVHE